MTDARETFVADCTIVSLSRHVTESGCLTVLQAGVSCPFELERIYYLFDVPPGAVRGGHAHRALHQFLIAAAGSFDVELDDGSDRRTVALNRPDCALHLLPGIWRELKNFASGSICLVMASDRYDENDYFRHYSEFLAFKGKSPQNSRRHAHD